MDDRERKIVEGLTRKLMDDGKLIEAGWIALKAMAVSPNASEIQLDEMRNAFFAGAQHLFGSIMGGLDPDAEPTADDERRMELISKELTQFIREYELKFLPSKGRRDN